MSCVKNILITGVLSDVGSIIAREFLDNDQSIKIIGTTRKNCQSFDLEKQYPDRVKILNNINLIDNESCSKLSQFVNKGFFDEFGIVHSVGDFWDHVPFVEFNSDASKKMFDSHVTTFYNLMQSMIPVMRSKGGGSVITFSCNSVNYNYPDMASFTASKSALDSLTRTLSNEFSKDNIRFNSLVLSSLQTNKVKDSKPSGDYDNFIPPEDLIPTIQFLLSKGAYLVNGNTIKLFKHSPDFFNKGYFQRVQK